MCIFQPDNKSVKRGVKACKIFNHWEVAVTSGQLVFPGTRGLGSELPAFGSPGYSFAEGGIFFCWRRSPTCSLSGGLPGLPARPQASRPQASSAGNRWLQAFPLKWRIPLPSPPPRGNPQALGPLPSELCLDHLWGVHGWALALRGDRASGARAARRLPSPALPAQLRALLCNL